MAEDLLMLSGNTLADLDHGRAGEAIDRALAQAVRDCFDRPTDERARKVTVQIDITPIADIHGDAVSCEGANGVYKVRLRQPDWESGKLNFGVRKGGRHGAMLVFSPDSPQNHRQTLLPLEDENDQ